jgi:hypothetical protein
MPFATTAASTAVARINASLVITRRIRPVRKSTSAILTRQAASGPSKYKVGCRVGDAKSFVSAVKRSLSLAVLLVFLAPQSLGGSKHDPQGQLPSWRFDQTLRVTYGDGTRKRPATDLPFAHADAHPNSGRSLLLSGRRTSLLRVGHENLVRSQGVGYGRGTVSRSSEASYLGRVPPRASGALSSVSRRDGPARAIRKQDQSQMVQGSAIDSSVIGSQFEKRSSGPRISRAASTSSSRTIKSIVAISGRTGCGPPLIAASISYASKALLANSA